MTQQWVNAMKTIVLDWNGVLDTYVGWRGPDYLYPVRPGAREFLTCLKAMGWTVVVCSAASEDNVRKFLDATDLSQYVDKVTNKKVPALIYVDDRGLKFNGDFLQTMMDVCKFKTFWENESHKEGGNVSNWPQCSTPLSRNLNCEFELLRRAQVIEMTDYQAVNTVSRLAGLYDLVEASETPQKYSNVLMNFEPPSEDDIFNYWGISPERQKTFYEAIEQVRASKHV